MDYGNVEQWLHHASGNSASVRAGSHSLRRAARVIAEARSDRMVRVTDRGKVVGRMFFDDYAWALYWGIGGAHTHRL